MTLLVIAIGLYAIGIAGYAKLFHRSILEAEDTAEFAYAYPVLYRSLVGLVSALWPIAVYWMLIKEASRTPEVK